MYAPQRPSHGERRPALRCDGPRRFEAPGLRRASSRARCDAPTTVHFSLREVRQETQIRGETRRIERVATLRAKPCSMDDTRQRSTGQIGPSAHVQRARVRMIEGGEGDFVQRLLADPCNSTPIVLIKSLCQFLPYLGFSHPQRVSQLARYDARRSREGMDQDGEREVMHELHVVPVVIAHVGHRGSSSKILLRAGRSHRFSSDSAFRAPWCLHSSDDGRPNERTGVALCSCEARTHKDGGPALAEKSVRPLGPTWCPPCMEVC